MMWGCMTWQGVGYAAKIDGRMDDNRYLQILKDELLNTMEYYGLNPPNTIFSKTRPQAHLENSQGMASRAGFQNYGMACTVSLPKPP